MMLLCGISWGSNRVAEFSGLPVPGNVLGVVVLFALLALGVVKLDQVEDGADFLLRHMILFFVPFVVSLVEWGPVLAEYGLVMAVALVLSALIPFLTVGFLTALLHREDA